MEITITTPALLFPAISLIMLAYTNRFLSLASVVRHLHDRYKLDNKTNPVLHGQIKDLRYRLNLVKNMQIFGVASFLLAIICMYLIFIEQFKLAEIAFAAALLLFAISLLMSLVEILKSTTSLELELSDVEGLEDPNFVEYLKKKIKG
jgi:hypothetical protein